MLVHAPADAKRASASRVEVATGGAAPPSAVIEAMEAMGFRVTHLYGLTESYGPATLCAWQDEWARSRCRSAREDGAPGRARCRRSRLQVGDPDTARPVPRDGATLGEVMLRGNTIMKGYLDNPTATAQAFAAAGSTPATSRCGIPTTTSRSRTAPRTSSSPAARTSVSLEVEECLYRHPQVMEAAVVAQPDANGARRRARS
jgi:fatty-acyl-CoA synthase